MIHSMSASKIVTYKIDPALSNLMIYTSNSGILASAGHKLEIKAHDISGTIKLDPNSLSSGVLDLQVTASSLKVISPTPEKDKKEIEERLCTQVLDCDIFPNITFKSIQLEAQDKLSHKMMGALTLHGITQSIPLELDIIQENKQLEASGEIKLKQSDFKIKPPTVLGGMIKVKDEIKITFHMVAHP